MNDELAGLLAQWRTHTLCAGSRLGLCVTTFQRSAALQPVPAMSYHVQSAAKAAGITKHVRWHVFRHSVGSLLGQSGEKGKVVQEILRHANSRITQEVYQQADQTAKRTALKKFSGLFAVQEQKST